MLLIAAKKESWPVRRPLVNMHEVARQTISRDGPRYPDEGFLRHVRTCRAPYDPKGAPQQSLKNSQIQLSDCDRGYAILTMGNNVAMDYLIPVLLESLQRIEHQGADGEPDDLTSHTVVMGVTSDAAAKCTKLQRSYHHSCTGDGSSGLFNGDQKQPSFKAAAFGMAKLRYIINALTTNIDILYVDADVIFLEDPFPTLLASSAGISVGVAPEPCGSKPTPWDEDTPKAPSMADLSSQHNDHWRHSRSLAGSQGAEGGEVLWSTGIAFFRSTPAVMRCTYSLILDMAYHANPKNNGSQEVVREQERFAAFMPMCAGTLGTELRLLDAAAFPTTCGAAVSEEARKKALVIHASHPPGAGLRERAPLLMDLLGIKHDDHFEAAEGEGKEEA
ncbi:hypothetical protein HYH03_001405 [Edaphochlamys debaryana]|uniref:Nucleotide-diphospho-sugar transferase domain-containing protein n=1 Tax=Edaphochlamys debaryana TaxID=47281 RepID=A0A836C611_9CHLO|nr:hypothetical protein HYH03_001405 [Edaphochlamys debaryana]|eukprot:KAG2500638.1 hypothetical protein HYH03_001405 [Edaphochlamys debaryana]